MCVRVCVYRYVADKMGGPIERGQLSSFSWELAMSQLKVELKSNIVPIGKVKFGIHYHRALLFKVHKPLLSCKQCCGEVLFVTKRSFLSAVETLLNRKLYMIVMAAETQNIWILCSAQQCWLTK